MKLLTDNLILRTVTIDDLNEVSRMWNFQRGSISLKESESAIRNMQSNHKKNKSGCIYHICFAVFEKNDNKRIIGWCGLDGIVAKGKNVILYEEGMSHPADMAWNAYLNKEEHASFLSKCSACGKLQKGLLAKRN